MAHPMGESKPGCLRVVFDRRLKLEFHGSKITSDAGLLAYRELDDALGLTEMAEGVFQDSRTGKNGWHGMTGQFAKSDSMIRISATLKCRLKAATMPSESLLGIAGDISASTCTELYSGKWVHTTYSGCG